MNGIPEKKNLLKGVCGRFITEVKVEGFMKRHLFDYSQLENFKGMDAAESMDRRGRGEKEEGGRKRGEEREGREREKV